MSEKLCGESFERVEFVGFDVVFTVLGKNVREKCTFTGFEKGNGAKSAGFTLTFPCDTLFNDTAAKIRID